MSARRDRQLAAAHSIEDLRALARKKLPLMVFDYIDGGALTESSLRRNREDIGAVGLVPAPLRDVSHRDPSFEIFGRRSRMPIIIGPTGFNATYWPMGDLALARAAAAADIPFVMSNGANVSMAALRADAEARHWFQLYLPLDRERWAPLIGQAAQAGFEAIEVTVDTAVPGRRLRDLRHGFGLPLRWTPRKLLQMAMRPGWSLAMARHGMPQPIIMMEAFADGARNATMSELMGKQINPSVTWDDIRRLRDMWKGKLIIKGLLDPAQMEPAIAAGCDAVLLSNHGGRQMDGSVSTISMLPECAAVVRDRVPLLIDSGFRTGTDVLKALALGATAVQVGRATLWGLAAGGEQGVTRALDIFASELDQAMALAGVANTQQAARVDTRPRR